MNLGGCSERGCLYSEFVPLLVLASSSPRRAALLSEGGFEFETASPRVAEKVGTTLTLRELTLWNAIRKGMSIAQTRPDAVVLAADTLVALEHQIIGKSADLSAAARILESLSGRTHEVCSAVAIYQQTAGRSAVFHESSRVRFHRLNNATIENYLAKVGPLDKAGAYAAQGTGAEIIAKIQGSFTNVVGLPMEKTVVELAKFGIRQNRPNELSYLANLKSGVRGYLIGVGSFLFADCAAPERNARSCFWRA